MTQVLEQTKTITRAEYQALPEGPPYYELVRGELAEMTRPSREHYLLSTYLIEVLGPHVRRVLRGELAPEPNLYLPEVEDVYHPDLVFVEHAHRQICKKTGIYGTPNVICEILSRTTEKKDRGVKMENFRRAGVPHVWLIHPEPPVMVEEFVLSEQGWYVLHGAFTAPAEWEPAAFPGWRLSLAEVDAAAAPFEEEGNAQEGEPGEEG